MAAINAAKKAGIFLSYDPNVRLPLWPSEEAAREGILSIWKEPDVIKVSDDEVAFLTKGDPQNEEVVLSLWHDGLKLLVVTDGEKGCRYFTKVGHLLLFSAFCLAILSSWMLSSLSLSLSLSLFIFYLSTIYLSFYNFLPSVDLQGEGARVCCEHR